jgi:hypothetical protein
LLALAGLIPLLVVLRSDEVFPALLVVTGCHGGLLVAPAALPGKPSVGRGS